MLFKKFVAPAVIGISLLGGVAAAGVTTAGVAAAATPGTTATATATATTSRHAARAWVKAHRQQLRKAGLAISAKAIGITSSQLATELRSGKSIAQVAGEHNVSAQTVVTDLVNAADAKVDQAVTANRLTAAQGAKIKAALPNLITKAVNHVF
jgi:transposase-like protein